MDKATLKALKGSIRKWVKIVVGEEIDLATENCPLCEMFFDRDCEGCPVKEKTGRTSCDGTPYQDKWVWVEPFGRNGNGGYRHSKKSKEAAIAEVAFLKSLLPEESK